MSWQDEEKRRLFEDYREGKITAAEFTAMREALNSGTETPTPARKSSSGIGRNLLFGGIGVIVLLLAVIAWLLFSNSPEQQARRLVRNLDVIGTQEKQVQDEASHIIACMRLLKAAYMMFEADSFNNPGALQNVRYPDLIKYIDHPGDIYQTENLSFERQTRGMVLVYNLKNTDKGVKQRLEEKAEQLGLTDSFGVPFKASMRYVYFLVGK